MKISLNWLSQYLNTKLSADQTADMLTQIGLEVEKVEHFSSIEGGLQNFVVGEVLTCQKHPDADKLSVTTVNVGNGEALNIVCGAPNVAAGQKVIVALQGAVVTKGTESFTIKKGKIRGMASEGMICAEDELGVGDDHAGIMVLEPNTKVGLPAADYFKVENDTVLEIGLTPNRIDAASHFGVARDLAAFLNRQNMENKLTLPSVEGFKIDNKNFTIPVEIVNADACKRYVGITISGITVKDSPDWLKNRLRAIGQKPINNVVDVTNYVLHELGQPLHAFDAAQIKGNKVVVKTMPEATEFVTLDGVTRKLAVTDLMICNTEAPMCIAGVFGGLESGVTAKTTAMFLESAYFDAGYIRKTAKKHTLSTDASFRFERGADPEICVFALKRAAMLMKELAGGEISSDIIDVYPQPIKPVQVKLAYKRINSLIGEEVPADLVKTILKSLDIIITSETADELNVIVPLYRSDVTRDVDIIEDILRIYGYNTVKVAEKVNSTLSYAPKPDSEKLKNLVSDLLVSRGSNEAMSNSLTKGSYYDGLQQHPATSSAKILNPLSNDLNVLRQTLFFGLMEAVKRNKNYKTGNIRLFEFGNCYSYKTGAANTLSNYSETFKLAFAVSGNKSEVSWNNPKAESDFFQLKALVDAVFEKLNFDVDAFQVKESENEFLDFGLTYVLNTKEMAYFGKVSEMQAKNFDVDGAVFYAEINWDLILKYFNPKVKYTELPKYPEVKRDLALLLDKKVSFAQLHALALKAENKLLKKVSIFDVYSGKNIDASKKSYALSFVIQDETKTLTDKQIDKIMSKLVQVFEQEAGAVLR